ncbi:F-box protein FBW2-like [Zingiber officinale]|uniref:F-box protein FBW2-like n=1 Tax=Zingiber officinale TaxID=94328 RepID=UPI001C4A82E1|nr:F-box protein FBW2-like [Zingiber officinale]
MGNCWVRGKTSVYEECHPVRSQECRLIPLSGGGDMAEGSDARAWEELIPDALGLIFRNLPPQEILTVIPRVCKSWSRVVLGPYCWQEIDIDEWSQHCKPEQLDKMLHMLIDRSCGSFRRLSVSGLHTESMFTLIADHVGSLQRLELPRSEMNDAIVKLVAPRLCNLTYLDVSYCSKIGACAIEAFGSLSFRSRSLRPHRFRFLRQDNVVRKTRHFTPSMYWCSVTALSNLAKWSSRRVVLPGLPFSCVSNGVSHQRMMPDLYQPGPSLLPGSRTALNARGTSA